MKAIEITIPGFSISGKAWGAKEKPTILALHGWLDNANSFDLLAPLLQNDFHFIAIDLPGHGHSSHLPEGCNYHFFDGVFLIIELINSLKLEKIHLLGHSMGACMASLMAGVAPQRLHSLYLIEALGPFSAPAETACTQLSAYAAFLAQSGKKKSKGYRDFSQAVEARAAKGYISTNLAALLCQRALVEDGGGFYWRHDKRLLARSPLRLTEEQVLSCLKNIKSPTELLLSSEGFSFDPLILQQRIHAVPTIQVKKLQGGHHIHMEQPEAVSQLLADFYKKV